MKSTVLLMCLALVLADVFGEKYYTSKYDNIDVDAILKSDRLTLNYLNCLLDRGRCTPDGKLLKETINDALESDCIKCSPKQKEVGAKVLKFILKNKREYFDLVAARYDPKGKYIAKYKDQLKKEGIFL